MKKATKKGLSKFISKFDIWDIRTNDIWDKKGNIVRRVYNKNKLIAIILNWHKYWIVGV